MRESQVVTMELAAVAGELTTPSSDSRQEDRLRGALAALEWAVGNKSEAPVSGRFIERPGADAILTEQEWATEVVTGIRPATSQLSRAYAGGAEEALFWLNGADCAPVDTDEIAQFTQQALTALLREALESLHEAMTMEQASPPSHYDAHDLSTLAGILAALEWLLGTHDDCPVLGLRGPATPELVAEAAGQIEDVANGLPNEPGQRPYGFGVAAVLDWANGGARLPSVY